MSTPSSKNRRLDAISRLSLQQATAISALDASTPRRVEGGETKPVVSPRASTPMQRKASAEIEPAGIHVPKTLRPFSAQRARTATRIPHPPTKGEKPPTQCVPTMTERIGALHSNSNIRTPFQERSIPLVEVRKTFVSGPTPAAAVAKPHHDGVPGSDPHLSHFLDASDFDDFDAVSQFEREGPGCIAASHYYTPSQQVVMEPCQILSFNASSRRFRIRWIRSGKTKEVAPLLVRFPSETDSSHSERVKKARTHRDAEEAMIRFRNYIEAVEHAPSPTPQDQVARVLLAVAKDFPTRHLELLEKCLDDIEDVRSFGLKRALVRYQLLDTTERARLKQLRMFEEPPASPPDLRHCVGTLQLKKRSQRFQVYRKFLSEELFSAHPPLYNALRFAVNRWFAFDRRFLIDIETCLEKAPSELVDFTRHQSQHNKQAATALREAWMNSIVGCLQSELTNTFNFFEDSLERFEKSRMCRFLRMLHLCLGGQLQGLVYSSLSALRKFADSLQLPEVVRAAVEDEGLGTDHRQSGDFLCVVGCHALQVIVPPVMRARDLKPPPPEKYGSALDDAPPLIHGTQPLLTVRLEAMPEEGVVFTPSLDDVRAALMDMYDSIFSSTDNIADLTVQLFPLLAVPATPLTHHAQTLRSQDDSVSDCKKALEDMLNDNLCGPVALLRLYAPFDYLLTIDVDSWVEEFSGSGDDLPKLEDYDVVCQRLHDHIEAISSRSFNEVAFPLLRIETYQAKAALRNKAQQLISRVLTLLIERTNNWIEDVSKRYEDIHDRLLVDPTNPDELKELRDFVDRVPLLMQELSDEFDDITANVQLLGKYGFMPDQSAFEKYWNSVGWPRKVDIVLDDIGFRLQSYRAEFLGKLRELTEQLQVDIKDVARQVSTLTYEDSLDTDVDKILSTVEGLETKLDALNAKSQLYNNHEKIFQLPTTKWTSLRETLQQFHPYCTLWKVAHDSCRIESWLDSKLEALKPEDIVMHHTMWTNDIAKLTKTLANEPPFRVVLALKTKLDNFRRVIPLISALAKPSLLSRRRHVNKIGELIGEKNLDLQAKTLQDVLNLKLDEHIGRIQEYSEQADHEHKLERQLGSNKDAWQRVVFKLQPYRDTYALKDTEEIRELLDDSLFKAQTMLASPFASEDFRVELQDWEQKLANMSEILDEWVRCQFGYCYLAPIFASDDFASAMPEEARIFETIHDHWVTLMEKTQKFHYVQSRCSEEKLFSKLKDSNTKLDKLLRELAKFLDTKRVAFPRFFFLSNEDLIEILSESKEPTRVQPHVTKCFEGIGRLTFTEMNDVVEMRSPEKEVVPLATVVSPSASNNTVEKWLAKLEDSMVHTVRETIQKAVNDFAGRPSAHSQWVLSWPGQAILAASMIHWTNGVEEAILQGDLPRQCRLVEEHLQNLVELVRGKLSSIHMATLQALVVLQVHARDVVLSINAEKVSSLQAFSWTAQLRYYHESTTGKGKKRQLNLHLKSDRFKREGVRIRRRLLLKKIQNHWFRNSRKHEATTLLRTTTTPGETIPTTTAGISGSDSWN